MTDAESAALKAQVESLKKEKTDFLNELESIYRQVEEHLLSSGREREIAYRELRERNSALQNRLEELEKAHRDLRETQQMLIRSERLAAMGQMAAAIVHEISNPLGVILSNLELIRLEGGTAKDRYLAMLQYSSEYLHGLAENILRFARHHRGEPRDVDINNLVKGIVTLVKPLVRNLEVSTDLVSGLPSVRVNPSQMEQVLMNLVLNSIAAVGRIGEITVSTGRSTIRSAVRREDLRGRPHALVIQMEEEAFSFEYINVEVADNGPGIREDHLLEIFEAFFTTKGDGEGTGLGLAIARSIIGEWGGNILVASREGEGASFRVYLPILGA